MWAAAAIALAAAGSAQAGYTSVSYRPGGDAGERSQAEIMARFYGSGTFNTSDFVLSGNDFIGQGSYSALSFLRVEDFGASGAASVLNPLLIASSSISGVTDQVWRDGTVLVKSDAKYAGYNQRAGYKLGATGVATTNVIGDVTAFDSAGVVTAFNNTTFTAAPGSDFRLTRSGDGSNYALNEFSSEVAGNGDGLDHMITYLIQGLSGPATYMVFFDDQSGGGDRDFNDFSMTLTVVPLPPAAWAGIGSLACVAGFGVVRRRRMMMA
jgi:hypothetical protein